MSSLGDAKALPAMTIDEACRLVRDAALRKPHEVEFTRLGAVGALPPALAAWSPDVLFAIGTAYLLLRLKT